MRARNIKPGFYKNDQLAECSLMARYIFPGLWMLADKEGRIEDRPRKIKAELLPFDDFDVDALLEELRAQKLIVRYEAGGVRCIWIPTFAKHQTPHPREQASELPAYQGDAMDAPRSDLGGSKVEPRNVLAHLNPESLNPSSLNTEIQTPLTPLEPDAAVAADTDTRDSVPVEEPVPGWTEQPIPVDDPEQPPLPATPPDHAALDDCPLCQSDAAGSETKADMPSPAPTEGQLRAESSGTVDSLPQAGEAILGASTGQKSGMPQKAAGKRPRYRPKDYDAWIARYPRHRRTGAATQWDAACRDKRLPSLDVLMQALDWQITSEDWTKDGGQYVLGAGRYLKEGHWADEPPPQRQSLGGRMSMPIEDRSKWDSQHTKLGTWTPQDVANLFAGTR